MIDYGMLEEEIARCGALLDLLEQDKEELGDYLQGELLEEYRKLVDREIQNISEVRKKLNTMA